MAGVSLRRWGAWAIPIACLVLIAPLLTGSAIRRDHTLRAVRVLQLNLCGSGIAGCYTGRSVTEAAAVIRTAAPDVVTLNEICDGDLPVLERALVQVHRDTVESAFIAAPDRRTGGATRCRNGEAFGIGLLARASAGAAAADSGVYPAQDLKDPEIRAWLCLHTASLHACTTHLASTDAAVALAQCRYLLAAAIPAVHARRGYRPTVVGGDLNLRYGTAPDLRPCLPPGFQRLGDDGVQHILATGDVAVGSANMIAMSATDHPGLFATVVLT